MVFVHVTPPYSVSVTLRTPEWATHRGELFLTSTPYAYRHYFVVFIRASLSEKKEALKSFALQKGVFAQRNFHLSSYVFYPVHPACLRFASFLGMSWLIPSSLFALLAFKFSTPCVLLVRRKVWEEAALGCILWIFSYFGIIMRENSGAKKISLIKLRNSLG